MYYILCVFYTSRCQSESVEVYAMGYWHDYVRNQVFNYVLVYELSQTFCLFLYMRIVDNIF